MQNVNGNSEYKQDVYTFFSHPFEGILAVWNPSNGAELQQFCKEEWAKIPPQRHDRLISNYKKCLIAIVATKVQKKFRGQLLFPYRANYH